MRESAQPPAATRISTRPTTATRKRSASSMSLSIMASALRHLGARELRLHGECAGDDHDVARREAGEDLRLPAHRRADFDVAALEARAALAVGACDERDL